MFARSHTHPELEEMLKWAILVVLASALALFVVSIAGGVDATIKDVPAPGGLPPRWDDTQQPLIELTENPFELSALIWQALDHQRQGNLDDACALWQSLRLPGERDAWRHVAVAVAHLQTQRFEQASEQLAAAGQLSPDNPLVAYCVGILRLSQAETADEWYDATGPSWIRMVAAPVPEVAPNTRSMYQLAAMTALERALRQAERLDPELSLVTDTTQSPDEYRPALPIGQPKVRDLLEAIGLEKFEGKANLALADLHRLRGSLTHAEQHLDRGTVLGMATGGAYRDLGRSYEAMGMYGDAARAHLKSMAHGGGVAEPTLRVLEDLKRALFDVF